MFPLFLVDPLLLVFLRPKQQESGESIQQAGARIVQRIGKPFQVCVTRHFTFDCHWGTGTISWSQGIPVGWKPAMCNYQETQRITGGKHGPPFGWRQARRQRWILESALWAFWGFPSWFSNCRVPREHSPLFLLRDSLCLRLPRALPGSSYAPAIKNPRTRSPGAGAPCLD